MLLAIHCTQVAVLSFEWRHDGTLRSTKSVSENVFLVTLVALRSIIIVDEGDWWLIYD